MNDRSHLVYLACLALCFLGCSAKHSHPLKRSVSTISITERVINPSLLSKGGTIGFNTFKPGAKAEANDQLDHISLMVIKGFKEAIEQSKAGFTVVNGDEVPGFIVDGHIQEFSKNLSGMSRLMMQPAKWHLNLEGEIWLESSGEKVYVFNAEDDIGIKEDPMDAAYKIGQRIGTDFINHFENK